MAYTSVWGSFAFGSLLFELCGFRHKSCLESGTEGWANLEPVSHQATSLTYIIDPKQAARKGWALWACLGQGLWAYGL